MARKTKSIVFVGGYDAWYPRSRVLAAGLRAAGVRVTEFRVRPKFRTLSRWVRLASKLRECDVRADVVVVPEFAHKDVPLGALVAGFTGATLVFDPLVSKYETKIIDRRDASPRSFAAATSRAIDRLSTSLPALVLADTEIHARHFRSFAPPGQRVRVVPVGYDDSVFCPAPDARRERALRVLFYGSYVPLHGALTIVRAAARMRSSPVRFEMIGGGQTHGDARRLAGRLGAKNIEFVPRVAPEELPGRIAASDICLGIFGRGPKARRVVPNKVYQCMGSGRAVITADSPAIREFFEPGVDLVTVPPGDDFALASEIEQLACDDRLRAAIAARGMEQARSRFTPPRIAGALLRALEEIA